MTKINRQQLLIARGRQLPFWMRGTTWQHVLQSSLVLIVCGLVSCGSRSAWAASNAPAYASTVEQWGIEEVVLHSGHAYQNPFKEVHVQAQFNSGSKYVQYVLVDGFYDGDQNWKIRLMPESQGHWTFRTISNDSTLNAQDGEFDVDPPTTDNHGPVFAAKTFHFSYADGTPYFLLGTTAYNWLNRDAPREQRTLVALAQSPFTKLRFGLFPLWYEYNRVDPPAYPYVQIAKRKFDFDRFDPKFFAHIEDRLRDLQRLGILADIILFLPYDDWGFARMEPPQDDAYIHYVTARLAAFRNVWWTMANEYNFWNPHVPKEWNEPGAPRRLPYKNWDHLFRVLQSSDPYHHERGIHNIGTWYDPSKPWVTHVIAQEGDTAARLTLKARRLFRKPVVIDEYGYEGNFMCGKLSPTEGSDRHWEITMAGGYASQGECYVQQDGGLWWAVGGDLASNGPTRLGFLKEIMMAAPFQDLVPAPDLVMGGAALAKRGEYYLFRFGLSTGAVPAQIKIEGTGMFSVDLIDPWQMRIFPLGCTSTGIQAFKLALAPSLLRFSKVAFCDSSVPTGSVSTLIAKFTGETNRLVAVNVPLFAAEPDRFSTNYTVGELMDDSRTRTLVEKYAPSLFKLATDSPFVLGFPLFLWNNASPFGDDVRIDTLRFGELSGELAKTPVD